MGWPLQGGTSGGGFLYHFDNNRIAVGLIVDLKLQTRSRTKPHKLLGVPLYLKKNIHTQQHRQHQRQQHTIELELVNN